MSEATKKLDEILMSLPPQTKRLIFPEKCAAYFALQRGFSQTLVAKVFGISQGSISSLAHCRKKGPHYHDVATEYDKLGHEAFGEKYFTDEHVQKFQRWRMGVETDADRARQSGPDPTRRKGAQKFFVVEGLNETFFLCLVDFRNFGDIDTRTNENLRSGWAWRYAEDNERETLVMFPISPRDAPPWSADRWPNAQRAIDGCYEQHGSDSERLEENWPNHRDLKTGYRK